MPLSASLSPRSAIQLARTNLEVAKLETEKAQAGHKPTLDLTMGYNTQRNLNGTAVSPTSMKPTLLIDE